MVKKIDTTSDEFRDVKTLALEGKSIRFIARSTHVAYETCRRWVALIEAEKAKAKAEKAEKAEDDVVNKEPQTIYEYWVRAMDAVRRNQQCR